MRIVALITGASTGIGADLARVFARHGHDLALVARSTDKLDALADALVATGRPRPLVIACDLGTREAVETIGAALAAHDARVVVLVNNAGWGLHGDVATLDANAQLDVVDVNVRALLELTLRCLPDLRAARGKILNVGSVASFLPGPGMAVYYATKAFVRSFSNALAQEQRTAGVTVSVLHPGVTRTEFHARAGMADGARLGRRPGASSMAVAEAGYAGLMAGRRTIVPGVANKAMTLLLPLVPDAILLPLVHRFQSGRR